ncbi:deoxycytidine triphosphate deaminase [Salinarchaeum sp. Harcht-Bsk1]|uniref:dCTP deaminase n=1 Tax=Salinarchaeum sp. Harcht-Bsk1 TaxID=1333523 RepID=UPI0003423261|nr:dCTP deaminase [Salinarchaeum sp. Harcht-Bsk1]AGN00575.1 deoxycytidine triphosphate deaminase [Salinarchaeum sp. Harcht-Bsk1]
MILSDRDIRRRLNDGDLSIEPLDDPEMQIQPASVDMRLGREFLTFEQSNIPCIRPDRAADASEYTTRTTIPDSSQSGGQRTLQDVADDADEETDTIDEEFILHPGDFVLATTKERVAIPDDLIAHVEGRSSLGRLAIVVHATAGIVDPGYEGQITLELSNLGTAPVALKPDMRISQLTFTKLSSAAERPYGEERGSKYQGQTGPQASRIGSDREFGGDQ